MIFHSILFVGNDFTVEETIISVENSFVTFDGSVNVNRKAQLDVTSSGTLVIGDSIILSLRPFYLTLSALTLSETSVMVLSSSELDVGSLLTLPYSSLAIDRGTKINVTSCSVDIQGTITLNNFNFSDFSGSGVTILSTPTNCGNF